MSTCFRAGCVESFLILYVPRLVLMAFQLRWLECVGIADRSAFDLNAHARVLLSGWKVLCRSGVCSLNLCMSSVTQAAKCDLQYKESLEKPIEREVLALTKASPTEPLHLKRCCKES